jgi:uncharacterized coiled-coil protein SlyX
MKTYTHCPSLARFTWLFVSALLLAFLVSVSDVAASDPQTGGLVALESRVAQLEGLLALKTEQLGELQQINAQQEDRIAALESDMETVNDDLTWLMETVEWLVEAYQDVASSVNWLIGKVNDILDWF